MAHSGPSIESSRRSVHNHLHEIEDEASSERRPILRDVQHTGTPSTSTWSSDNQPTSRSTTTRSNDFAPQRQESTRLPPSEEDADSIQHDHGNSGNLLPNHMSHNRVSFQPMTPLSSSEIESIESESHSLQDLETLIYRQRGITSHRENVPPRMPRTREMEDRRTRAIILAPKGKDPVENIIIVLHDRSGNESSLYNFASSHLQQRATGCLLLQGFSPVEGKENCFQWEENLDSFLRTSWLILSEIISDLLIGQCNFPARKIILFGQGEGAAAALAAFLTWNKVKFGGIVCIGGQLPSHFPPPEGPKSETAVLLLGGAVGATTDEARSRIEQYFSYVDCDLMKGKDDSLPRDQQLESLREFFGHRLYEYEWKKPAVLTFDGGGIKGYGSLLILQALMNKIGAEEKRLDPRTDSSFYPCVYKPKSTDSESSAVPVATSTSGLPDSSLFLPCHYFQYIAGTSTGGLISIMISRLRMTVDDGIEEYKNLGGDVFGKPRIFTLKKIVRDKFDEKRLHKAIEDVTMRHCNTSPVIMKWPSPEDLCRTTVVAYHDQGTSDDPYLIRTFETFGPGKLIRRASSSKTLDVRNHGPPQEMDIPQVGRATTAAPGYFRHLTVNLGQTKLRFKDGGFGCNNPSWEIYRDVLALLTNGSKDMGPFISVGTGVSEVRLFPASKQGRIRHKMAELKAATRGLITRTKGTHDNMRAVAYRDNRTRFHYSRFDGGRNLGAIAMDEWKPNDRTGLAFFTRGKHKHSGHETLSKIEDAMLKYLAQKDVQDELDTCARILVRRRRLQTRDQSRWDRFASASWYICPYERCPAAKRHDTLENFKSHMYRYHPNMAKGKYFEEEIKSARHCWLYRSRNDDVVRGDVANLEVDSGVDVINLELPPVVP